MIRYMQVVINMLLLLMLLYSYIKSWKTVPSDFSLMDGSSLNLSKVKGWLFKNLPDKHAHRYTYGIKEHNLITNGGMCVVTALF